MEFIVILNYILDRDLWNAESRFILDRDPDRIDNRIETISNPNLNARVLINHWKPWINFYLIRTIDTFFANMFSNVLMINFSNNSFHNEIPDFDFLPNLEEIYLNENRLRNLSNDNLFSAFLVELRLLDVEKNEIELLSVDIFSNLKSLLVLSLAHNRLARIDKAYFLSLFSLKHLNLSHNRIESIEANSFQNMNYLVSLDLSFNQLISITNDLFHGLTDLSSLYLYNNSQFLSFENQSFNSILNISNVFLDHALIKQHKCFFMHSIERTVRRNVSNKYLFFKSMNLITTQLIVTEMWCDLVFDLFQNKIHFNLKADYEVELFYETCKRSLIKRTNSFRNNFWKCFNSQVNDNNDSHDQIFVLHQNISNIRNILSNLAYLLTMGALITLLTPAIIYICTK